MCLYVCVRERHVQEQHFHLFMNVKAFLKKSTASFNEISIEISISLRLLVSVAVDLITFGWIA